MLHGGDRNESKAQPLAGSASVAGRGHNEPHMGARHLRGGAPVQARVNELRADGLGDGAVPKGVATAAGRRGGRTAWAPPGPEAGTGDGASRQAPERFLDAVVKAGAPRTDQGRTERCDLRGRRRDK